MIQVWDLAALRRELAALGLDWDADPVAPARPGPAGPVLVRVDGGSLAQPAIRPADRAKFAAECVAAALAPLHPEPHHRRGHLFANVGRHREAVADFDQALARDPRPRAAAHLYE